MGSEIFTISWEIFFSVLAALFAWRILASIFFLFGIGSQNAQLLLEAHEGVAKKLEIIARATSDSAANNKDMASILLNIDLNLARVNRKLAESIGED